MMVAMSSSMKATLAMLLGAMIALTAISWSLDAMIPAADRTRIGSESGTAHPR
jgi:hypothetical protein